MPRKFISAGALFTRLQRSLAYLTVGGEWALNHAPAVRRNLHWFWFDGFFASASDNIYLTYLTVYVLALGASSAQIGLMSALASLSSALVLLPGALLVERIGRRKQIVVVSSFVARTSFLLLALIPLLLQDQPLVIAAIALAVIRDTFSNLHYPAWMSLTGDIVPLEGRGHYFASRNFVMSLAAMLVTLIAGMVITRSQGLGGYQAVLAGAALLGFSATFCFGQIGDRRRAVPTRKSAFNPAMLWRDLRSSPFFLALCAAMALWNFALNIAGPFFTVYLVQNLNASGTMVALTAIATSISGMVAQRRLGPLVDRIGAHRLLVISSLLIPTTPVAWAFVTAPWQVILINLVGGGLWAAFNLASFNYLLTQMPDETRPRLSAVYQVVQLASLAAGAALGGQLVAHWGYAAVFLISASGRVIAGLLFSRLAPEEQRRKQQAARR